MRIHSSIILIIIAISSFSSHADLKGFKHPVFKNSDLLEGSKEYSRQFISENPNVEDMLHQLGLEYLHDLNPEKVYTYNTETQKVTVSNSIDVSAAGIIDSFGFGTPVAKISSPGADIIGQGKTVITCPFGGQTANVNGFMASTVSRDPIAGNRNGILVVDNFLDSISEVNFSILKAAGGAKNPINRTTMETTHTGSCGSEIKVANLVSTWPPLRIDLVIDDTGSMGSELSGVKFALSNFISTHNTDPNEVQRDVSYELISFKDSPVLRLANTEDSSTAISAVNSLFASGGADCPEDSIGALNLALDNLTGDDSSEGQIVLVTDASPGSGSIDSVISRAQGLDIKVNVLLSGDCVASGAASLSTLTATAAILSARDVFEQIANETGGLYFFKPNGTVNDYTEILTEIFKTTVSGNDTEPPVVTVNATPTMLWPPNHKMIHVDVEVHAIDDKDPDPVIKLVGISINEPNNGQGDGDTEADTLITEDGEIYLRAERSGTGEGRFYTITYQATDSSGNIGFGTVDVGVPHN